LNRDKQTLLDADAVLTSISLDSELKDYNLNYADVNAADLLRSGNLAARNSRYNSLPIYEGESNDSFLLTLSLNAGNVTANKNIVSFIVVEMTPESVRNVRAMDSKHKAKDMAKAVKKGIVPPKSLA